MPKPRVIYPCPWTKQGRVRPIPATRCTVCGYLAPGTADTCDACHWAAQDSPGLTNEKEDDLCTE
jgi:hypothetical protein